MLVQSPEIISFKSYQNHKAGNFSQRKSSVSAQSRQLIPQVQTQHLRANFVPFLGSKAKTDFNIISNPGIKFSEVGGLYNAKEALKLLKDHILNAESNYIIPKGYLLHGENGNGKHTLVKALAGELESSGVPVISTSGSDFVLQDEKTATDKLENLFKFASEKAQQNEKKTAIIFIDNIESICRSRSEDKSSDGAKSDKLLASFAHKLDSLPFGKDETIVIIGTTTNEKLLDDSVSSKFFALPVNKPANQDERFDILLALANRKDMRFGKTKEKNEENKRTILRDLADSTRGISAVQLESILIEAHNKAQKENRIFILPEDVRNAKLDFLYGPVQIKSSPDWYFKISANHELSHGVIRHIFGIMSDEDNKPWAKPQAIDVLNFNARNGTSASVSLKNPGFISKSFEYLFAEITSNYGGLAGEYLLNNGHHAAGIANDVEVNTGYIEDAISLFGMGKETGIIKPSKSFFVGLFNDKLKADEQVLSKETSRAAFSIVNFYREFIESLTDEIIEKSKSARRPDEPICITGEEFYKRADQWVNASEHRKENFEKLKQHLREAIKKARPEMPPVWNPENDREVAAEDLINHSK